MCRCDSSRCVCVVLLGLLMLGWVLCRLRKMLMKLLGRMWLLVLISLFMGMVSVCLFGCSCSEKF